MASLSVVQDLDEATMTEAAARRLTEKIRTQAGRLEDAAAKLGDLLLEAHDGRAFLALGYGSWDSYVAGEFTGAHAMSRTSSYRLLDQARVIHEIAALPAAAPHAREIAEAVSGRQAAVLKTDITRAAPEIAAALDAGTPIAEAVRDAVARRSGTVHTNGHAAVAGPARRVLPVPSRDVTPGAEAEEDGIDLMGVATDLREWLRDTVTELRSYLAEAPKPKDEAKSEEGLWDECAAWLRAVAGFTAKANLERLFELQADIYRIMIRVGGPGAKARVAEMVGLTKEAVDYHRKNTDSAFPGL